MLDVKEAKGYINELCDLVSKAQSGKIGHSLVYESNAPLDHKNEFVCFVKPGITIENPSVKLPEILDLIFNKIGEFGLGIDTIKVLPGTYLETNNIMAQHYGVINNLSVDVRSAISEKGIENFEKIFGIPFKDADVYGGHEFLEKFPKFSAYSLSVMWQSSGFEKITSGTYAGKFSFDGADHYLVNGFHPRQLNHFNLEGRSVILLSLSGDIDWSIARNELIGLTDPAKAKPGSIRHEMLEMKEQLGIPIMNTAYNGVHLSAGPVEALNELIRFISDYTDKSKVKTISDFKIGKILQENFNPQQIDKILQNEKVEKDGHTFCSFDLTEEKNTDEMVDILKEYY